MQMKLAIVVKQTMAISNPRKGKKTSSRDKNVNKVDISPIKKKKAVTGHSKSVQMCMARTIFLSQTSMFSLFFIQFYL